MVNHNFDDTNQGQRMPAVMSVAMDPATGAPLLSPLPREAMLLTNAASTGAGVQWRGGRGTLEVWGTFGGATATFEASPDNGSTWLGLGPDGQFTAPGIAGFELPAGRLVRMSVSGGTGVNLNARMSAP